jgi:hypothetical protein
MKNILIVLLFLSFTLNVFSQAAQKPTIMIVPSDAWCNANGYMMEFDNQGKKVKVPDYKRALQENMDLKLVISKLNGLMTERGFPPKILEQVLKTLESEAAEDAMGTKNGVGFTESPADKLKKVAKADIWLYITWSINPAGLKKSVTFILDGADAYTDKPVGSASGTGQPALTAEIPVLLEEAVLSHIDNFNSQLQEHFNILFTKGREVTVRVKKLDSFDGDLESEYDGEELKTIIENWISDNTVNNSYNPSDATENMMLFEQVRIPLFDEKGKPTDTEKWLKGLQKMLKEKYQIPCNTGKKGIGQAVLTVGEK